MAPWTKEGNDLEQLCALAHPGPHKFLGLHSVHSTQKLIRIWAPGETYVQIRLGGKSQWLESAANDGLFTLLVPYAVTCRDYQVQWPDQTWVYDPYTFTSTFSPMDRALMNQGDLDPLYAAMANPYIVHEGIAGIRCVFWAPEAVGVSVVGAHNRHNLKGHPMRQVGATGIWELFIPTQEPLEYQYAVQVPDQEVAFISPPSQSIQKEPFLSESFMWQDAQWMQQRNIEHPLDQPLLIYEWQQEPVPSSSLETLVQKIAKRCQQRKVTHVQISSALWSGASIKSIAYFVNYLHTHSLGVLVHWCPESFLRDMALSGSFPPSLGLEGYCAYCILDWIERLHLDGCVFTAAEDPAQNEWYKQLQQKITEKWPHVLTILDGDVKHALVTSSPRDGGWGVSLLSHQDFKRIQESYIANMPVLSHSAFSSLCKLYEQAFTERYLLKVSLSPVIKGNDAIDLFTRLRLQYSMALCAPGKLCCDQSIEGMDEALYQGLSKHSPFIRAHHMRLSWLCFVRNLHTLYRTYRALWEIDFDKKGFAHILSPDYTNTVLGFLRHSMGDCVLCVHHLGSECLCDYTLPFAGVESLKEIFYSNLECYGGDAVVKRPIIVGTDSVTLTLPPHCTLIFEVQFVQKSSRDRKRIS